MAAALDIRLRRPSDKIDGSTEELLSHIAQQLRSLGDVATVELRLVEGRANKGPKVFSFGMSDVSVTAGQKRSPAAALTIVTKDETLRRIASGSYAPVQAYVDGKLAWQGDTELGKRILHHLAGNPAPAPVYGPLLSAGTWQLDGIGVGTLTISGFCFTPGGLVHITYDYGGGAYRKIVTADANNRFTAIEHGIPCGSLSTKPEFGVSVVAVDEESGKSVSRDYPTPC